MKATAKLLCRRVVTVTADTTIAEAAKIMHGNRIGCVPVVEDGRLKGIFTERDVVNRVVSQGVDPAVTPVGALMTPSPLAIDASEPIANVFELLAQRRFRHVPITENGLLVGIISLSDLAGVLTEAFKEEKYLQYFLGYLGDRP